MKIALQKERSHSIGEPFAVWDHLPGADVPDNQGAAKFIKLTAGEDGVGGFNEGLLGSESLVGSGRDLEASALILVGPLAGTTVHLLNTEEAVIRPRLISSELQSDQSQAHAHRITTSTDPNFQYAAGTGGANFHLAPGSNVGDSGAGRGFWITRHNTYNEDAQIGGGRTPNMGDETRPKNVSATYYMRVL